MKKRKMTKEDMVHTNKIPEDLKEEMIQAFKNKDPKKIAKVSAKILSKDKEALKFLAHNYLFVNSFSSEYNDLRKTDIKERRKEITKKWILYMKEKKIKFNFRRNREIVNSITKILGTEE